MYAALAQAVLAERGSDRAAADLARLRERHPSASRRELADRLIRQAAWRCAAAGAALTGGAAFFGAVPFGADLAYQVLALNRLVLSLSTLYGERARLEARTAGAMAGLALGAGAAGLRQGIVRILRRSLPRREGGRAVLGILLGGAIGWSAAVAIGRLAEEHFRGRGRLRLPAPRW